MTWGILAALGAGLCFAAGGVMQQLAAARQPSDESLSYRLLTQLARNRVWLFGVAVAALAYVLQALALFEAPLSVVQPLIVTELVFAIPLSVWLHRLALRPADWLAVFAVGGGLAAAIVAADPREGQPLAATWEWLVLLLTVTSVVGLSLVLARRAHPRWKAPAYALAAALAMAVEAALMDASTRLFHQGLATAFTSWEPYVMAVYSIMGLLLIQSAFQAGPLATSMPVVDAVQPVVAVAIGLTMFGERITTSPDRLGLTAVAMCVLLVGVLVLDTSPVVHAVYRQEVARRRGRGERRRQVVSLLEPGSETVAAAGGEPVAGPARQLLRRPPQAVQGASRPG